MKNILCIEDAPDVAHIIKFSLKTYNVVIATTLSEAKTLLDTQSFALVLVDLSLPDGDGLDILSHIAQKTSAPDELPIIILTAKKNILTKATAFSLGAEDYLEKPFDPAELKIRVDARVNRSERVQQRTDIRHVGDLLLNIGEQKLLISGSNQKIDLTSLEFRIFSTLSKAPERVFTREALIDQVWGKEIEITFRTVDTHIAHLRKKILKSGVQIETVFGSGYKLTIPNAFAQKIS